MTDHETPALRTQSPRRAVIIACILILLSALLWALGMWQLWSLVPQKKRIFDDFGMKLPLISEMVIDLSTWSMDFPFATAILCFFSILAALIGWICSTSYGIGARMLRGICALGFIFLPLAVNVVIAASMLLPEYKLWQGLQH